MKTCENDRTMHLEMMRDAARDMPAVVAPGLYESARIWHCKYRTLVPLAQLTELRALSIATVPDADLSFLVNLRKLEWLSLLHLPKVSELAPLAELKNLKFLSLETLPSWDSSRKRTVVRSLEPLQALANLEHLSLFGVITADKSLAPLEQCRNLGSAKFHGVPIKERDRFLLASGVADSHMPRPQIVNWPVD